MNISVEIRPGIYSKTNNPPHYLKISQFPPPRASFPHQWLDEKHISTSLQAFSQLQETNEAITLLQTSRKFRNTTCHSVHAKSASHRLHYHKVSQSQAREALRSASPVEKKPFLKNLWHHRGGKECVLWLWKRSAWLGLLNWQREEKECEVMLEESSVKGSAVKIYDKIY